MTEEDYARDGWFKAPRGLELAVDSAVRMGLLRVVEHGPGYFRLSGRGLRVVTDHTKFEMFPVATRLALQHFHVKQGERSEDEDRKREARKIQNVIGEAQRKADDEKG
jgi:hypothetical protein